MPRLLQWIGRLLLPLSMLESAQAADHFLVGVGTHLLNGERAVARPVQLIQEAGIVSIRDDLFWSSAERRPGKLAITPDSQRYLAALRERNLSNMLILGYGNTFYDNTAKPRVPWIKEGFVRYADFVSQRLRGTVGFYEIWNEWDMEAPASQALSDDYAALIKATVPVLRRNDPHVAILAGAVTSEGIDKGFAERLVRAGVMDSLDGLSLHPYVHCRKTWGRNTPERWIKWLDETASRLNGLAGRVVPLYLTEMSWPSSDETCGISESLQAAYLARSFFLARIHPSVRGMWWYDLLNDGRDAKDREHNFGLLDNDLKPKPAYLTLKAIAPYLSDYRFEPEHSVITAKLYQLRFSKGSEQVLVTWATGSSQPLQIHSSTPLKGGVQQLDTASAQAGMRETGTPWACDEHACTAVITASEAPKIINLGLANGLLAH